MPTVIVSKQMKQREAVREAKQRLKKGDKVVVAVEVTKVLDDGSVVIRVPGHGYPVMIGSKAADTFLERQGKSKEIPGQIPANHQ